MGGRIIILVIFALLPVDLYAVCGGASPNLISTDATQAEVQACVTAAVDGDTISIPSGTEDWSSPVSWTSKNISLIGAGEGSTIINSSATPFVVDVTTAKANFRISGMTINQSSSSAVTIKNNSQNPAGGAYSSGWRLDHLTITANGLDSVRSIHVYGVTYGVIDHVTWESDYGWAQFFTVYALTNDNSETPWDDPFVQGTISWGLAHALGDANAVYIEDSDITCSTAGGWGGDVVYGGEVVYRYNNITRCQISTHSSVDNRRGGKRMEIYNNNLIHQGATIDTRNLWWRSGTGVVFNNTVDSANKFALDNQRSFSAEATQCGVDGNAYDGDTYGDGWPCLDQVGILYGPVHGQIRDPLYAWNNGYEDDCRTTQAMCTNIKNLYVTNMSEIHIKTGEGHAGGQVDYVNNGTTPKPGYTSYTYPHPLRAQYHENGAQPLFN